MSLTAAVRAALEAVASADQAPEMRRYMKSEMPFLGVPKPARALALRPVFEEFAFTSAAAWTAAALDLWRSAEYREERYAAIDLTGVRRYAGWQLPGLLPVYEEFVVTGAWWDFVDEVASRRVGPLLRAFPAEVAPVMRAWAVDEDRWRRRTAIICQLSSKEALDPSLLTFAIESNQNDPDFFLRKAIGWSLRQHSRVAPDWVRTFVDSHPALSPLSRREALRNLPT